MESTHTISYQLQHLCSVLAKQSDQALQDQLGIGTSQFRILRVLQHSPQTRQRQIASWLGQTEASISRQIKLMTEQGLLQITISPKNKREHLTTLTSKGQKMAEQALKVLADCHSAMYSNLGEAKQQQLVKILSQMHENACWSGKDAGCHQPLPGAYPKTATN